MVLEDAAQVILCDPMAHLSGMRSTISVYARDEAELGTVLWQGSDAWLGGRLRRALLPWSG